MGADTSATHMIFFIVSVVISLGVAGALFMNVQSISNAATMGSKMLSEQLKTDITVINDPDTIPNPGGIAYTFYVKNTGKVTLSTAYITVLIDGTVVPDNSLSKTIIGGGVAWQTGDVLQINVTATIASGSHKIRVIAENGVEDEFEFRK